MTAYKRSFLRVGPGIRQFCPSETIHLIYPDNRQFIRWIIKKSIASARGYYNSFTELADHYNDELDVLVLRRVPLCRCVLLYPRFLRGSVGCRSPPINLIFQKFQIDWRYITWMLTRKEYSFPLCLKLVAGELQCHHSQIQI